MLLLEHILDFDWWGKFNPTKTSVVVSLSTAHLELGLSAPSAVKNQGIVCSSSGSVAAAEPAGWVIEIRDWTSSCGALR